MIDQFYIYILNTRKEREIMINIKNSKVIIILSIVGILSFIPIPTFILDILMALNLIFALSLFLVTIFQKNVKGLSPNPKLILMFTIYNITINIAAVRLILTKGETFDGRLILAISSLIRSSGRIGNLIIGIILFCIIIAILILVISKNAERISEMAIRFALDTMEIKQMSINMELSNEIIKQEEYDLYKKTLQQELNFYRSMDGVMKFILGYIKLNIFFILVVIGSEILINMISHKKSIIETLQIYSPLAISNGFLSLVSIFLITIAVSMKTTMLALHTSSELASGKEILPVDPISLELGYGLVSVLLKDNGAELIKRIQDLRSQILLDKKINIPLIRILDNLLLDLSEYRIKIRGVDMGKGIIHSEQYLCINPDTVSKELAGKKFNDPIFGHSAIWIDKNKYEEAKKAGYTVLDAISIIVVHLTEIIKQHITEFQDIKKQEDNV